jgi:putative flippase GtrA
LISLLKNKLNNSALLRNYILGFFNLLFNLLLLNQFQYLVFINIDSNIRTDLSITISFLIGISLSYFLTRRFVFRLDDIRGSLKMYLKFISTNLLNYFVPILIWYLIERVYIDYSIYFFNTVNFVIANILFPIKFLIYKFFIFKKE